MQKGEFFYYFSTMGGGKSLELILDEYRARHRNLATALVKPARDKKSGTGIETRFGRTRLEVDLLLSHDIRTATYELSDILTSKLSSQKPVHIYIDEVQFLTEGHVLLMREVADRGLATIKAYGLLTDFTGSLFESSRALVELADHKIQISSHCEVDNCDKIAVYNARIVDGKVTTQGPTVAIDGIDASYKAICSTHYTLSTRS